MAKFIYTKNHTYRCTTCGYEYKELPPEDSSGETCPNCWMTKVTEGYANVNVQRDNQKV